MATKKKAAAAKVAKVKKAAPGATLADIAKDFVKADKEKAETEKQPKTAVKKAAAVPAAAAPGKKLSAAEQESLNIFIYKRKIV